MAQARQLHIVDEESEQALETPRSLYEQAPESELPLDMEIGPRPDRFVEAVLEELGKPDRGVGTWNARIVDRLEDDHLGDVDLGVLLAFPDESLMFVGSDPTARDAIPLFGFIIERGMPLPTPQTAQEALDLLRPGEVQEAFAEGDAPPRQGEWFLLPTELVPVGSVFKPGVKKRPFGPSPLGDHVPREYAFTITDDGFMRRFDEIAPQARGVNRPSEAVGWLHRQRFFDDVGAVEIPDAVPEWEDLQDLAGDILVRGTLRHRENDHFLENVGDRWHRAVTHDVDVYTGDDYLERVRLD